MSRIASTVLIMLILLNGMSTVMAASGLNEDLGVTLNPGAEDTMEDVISNAKAGFSPSANIVQSFVGVSLAALNLFELFIKGLTTAGPVMFLNLGFPTWIVAPVFAPMYLVATFEFIYIATSRNPM